MLNFGLLGGGGGIPRVDIVSLWKVYDTDHFNDSMGVSDRTLYQRHHIAVSGSTDFTHAGIVGTETVTAKSGTADVIVAAGKLTVGSVTPGTLWTFTLSNGSTYEFATPLTATTGVVFDTSGNGRHLLFAVADTAVTCVSSREKGSDFNNLFGWTLSDGSSEFINTNGTGLIPINKVIPALRDGSGCSAYLADGTKAPADFTGRAKYPFTAESDWDNATPPDAPEPREASGWVFNTATPLYNANGTPKTVASRYDLFEYAVGPRLFYSPDKATKGIALYSADKDATAELKVWKAMGTQYALPTPTAFFNGVPTLAERTADNATFTGGSTSFLDWQNKLRIVPANSMAKTGMLVATTVAENATLGSEIGTGTFTGWTINSEPGSNITSGTLNLINTASTHVVAYKTVPPFVVGKRYLVTYTVSSISSGGVVFRPNSATNIPTAHGIGDFEVELIGKGNGGLEIVALTGTTCSLTVNSIKEVIPTYYDTKLDGSAIVDSVSQVTRTSATALTGDDLGPELLPNPSFDTNTTGWTATRCTLASVAGGQSGNCLELTYVSGVTQYAGYDFTSLTINDKFKVGVWVKSGTSGNEAFKLLLLDTSYALIGEVVGVSSATWTYHYIIITAPTTTVRLALVKSTATAGTMLFDEASFKKVLPTWTNVFTNNTPVKRYSITNPLTMPGFLCEPARTNKCTCVKANPTATTNFTGDTSYLSVVSDPSGYITSAGLEKVCTSGKLYKIYNSSGAAIFITINGTTTNTNKHSLSYYGVTDVYDANCGCRLTTLATVGSFPTTFGRVKLENLTPTATSNAFEFRVPAGRTVYFILPQLEEGAFATSPICQLDQTASESRAATVLTYPTAGKIRSNNMAFRMIVVPRATGQVNVRLFSNYYDSNNNFELLFGGAGVPTVDCKVSGTSIYPAAGSVNTAGVPQDIIVVKTTQGISITSRTYSGGWGAWVSAGSNTTPTAQAAVPLATSFGIGCQASGTSNFTGNISLFDAIPIPTGIADPLAWAKQQWGL